MEIFVTRIMFCRFVNCSRDQWKQSKLYNHLKISLVIRNAGRFQYDFTFVFNIAPVLLVCCIWFRGRRYEIWTGPEGFDLPITVLNICGLSLYAWQPWRYWKNYFSADCGCRKRFSKHALTYCADRKSKPDIGNGVVVRKKVVMQCRFYRIRYDSFSLAVAPLSSFPPPWREVPRMAKGWEG